MKEKLFLDGAIFNLIQSNTYEGTLEKDIWIDGIEYAEKTALQLYTDGVVKQGYLKRNFEIQGVVFKKDHTPVNFYENRKLKSGHLYRSQYINDIFFRSHSLVEFYSSGALHTGILNGDQTVQDMEFENGTLIMFHENGKVQSGCLNRSHSIDGKIYPKGTWIELDEKGKLILQEAIQ